MYCQKCGSQNLEDAKFCKNCGISMSIKNESSNNYANNYSSNVQQIIDIYSDFFKIDSINAAEKEKMKKTFFPKKPMAYGWGLLFHYLTLGIFTVFNYGSKYSKLPLLTPHDFKSGTAIGYCFIPFYNFYWIFIYMRHLAFRINFQFKLRNEEPPIPAGLATAIAIISLIPYFGLIPNYLVLWPIMYVKVQKAHNKLYNYQAS
jgi:hypothetical protein